MQLCLVFWPVARESVVAKQANCKIVDTELAGRLNRLLSTASGLVLHLFIPLSIHLSTTAVVFDMN